MNWRKMGMLLLMMTTFLGCTEVSDGLEPVSEFDAAKYLGNWYEIARLDHSFEKI